MPKRRANQLSWNNLVTLHQHREVTASADKDMRGSAPTAGPSIDGQTVTGQNPNKNYIVTSSDGLQPNSDGVCLCVCQFSSCILEQQCCLETWAWWIKAPPSFMVFVAGKTGTTLFLDGRPGKTVQGRQVQRVLRANGHVGRPNAVFHLASVCHRCLWGRARA